MVLIESQSRIKTRNEGYVHSFIQDISQNLKCENKEIRKQKVSLPDSPKRINPIRRSAIDKRENLAEEMQDFTQEIQVKGKSIL